MLNSRYAAVCFPPPCAFAAHCAWPARCPRASGLPWPQDLYKPEGPRLRKHLSAILNFAMFREEKLAAYTALQEQLEGLLQAGGGAAAAGLGWDAPGCQAGQRQGAA